LRYDVIDEIDRLNREAPSHEFDGCHLCRWSIRLEERWEDWRGK
jgi:hypothetical protein